MVREVKISLLVVDDDPLVLEALGRYFASAEDMEVRATAENGKVALKLLQEQEFDVLVADIHMPEMDGTTLVREAVRGGTVVTPQSLTRLFEQLPGWNAEKSNSNGANDTAKLKDNHHISPALEQVLDLVCQGKSNEEIAKSTHYAPGTVKKYVSTLLSEFHAKSRLELAVKALKAGYGS